MKNKPYVKQQSLFGKPVHNIGIDLPIGVTDELTETLFDIETPEEQINNTHIETEVGKKKTQESKSNWTPRYCTEHIKHVSGFCITCGLKQQ